MIKNLHLNYLTPLIISILIQSTPGFGQDSADCGHFRTQTQGGWGTQANGGNPGSYRDGHFNEAFPDGITIGCTHTLNFSSSADVAAFLPSGTSARILTESHTNPTNYRNVLAGQLLALTLSVGFDDTDPDFSPSETFLSQQIVNSGSFEGFSVGQILTWANELFGGCESNYSPAEINGVLSSINENYVDGTTNNGFLDCPETGIECVMTIDDLSTNCTLNDTYELHILLSGSNTAFEVISESAILGNGTSYCFGNPDNAITQFEIILEFPQGVDYDFRVNQITYVDCADPTTFNCSIDQVTGPAPDCCSLEILCEELAQTSFQCIGQIPPANPDGISILSNCGETTITVSETSQGNGCSSSPYILVRTYTLSNGADMVSCAQIFEVIDNVAPIIECPSTQNVSCGASILPDSYAIASDECDADVSVSYYDGPMQNCGEFTRTWIATDNCGNSSYCYQTVLVDDQTPPTLSVPANVVVDCGYEIGPEWIGVATATDYCSDVYITFQDSEPTGEGCSQAITRTWTAEDACGNSTSADQIITQTDMSGPAILGVPLGSNLQCGDIPLAPEGYAVDNCQGDTLDVSMEEFISINGCRTVVSRTYTATDACGNTTTLLRNFTIEDTQGPELTCPSDVLLACGDENIGPENTGMLNAMDNCSGVFITVSFEDSERDDSACPPGFQRYWTAVDTCGNVSNCVQQINFDDQQAPEMECLDPITIDCSEGNISPEYTGTPEAFDTCSDVTLQYTDGPLDGNCPATFTRTWAASDACGNMAYCDQNITVIDNEAPILTCPVDITISCAYQNAQPSITGYAYAVDQCLDVFLTYEDGAVTGDCEKSFIRTWIANDACGNTATCQQEIHFADAMLPVVFCPADTMLTCGANTTPEFLGTATAVDFCSEVTVSHSDEMIPNACPPGIARIWTATDACGNTKSCVQTILFEEFALPEINCPNDITIACDSNTDPIYTGSPSLVESCSDISLTYTDSLIGNETTETSEDCGQLRTQTQGGWGTRASGNNPGTYRDAHFEDAFPDGLVVGCDYTLTLTSSAAVQGFLPNGGPIRILTGDLVDPTNFRTVFAGQLVAATLSLGFDAADPDFGAADATLADMVIQSGDFTDYTVAEVVALANEYFGGCETTVSGSSLNAVLTAINENYVDGNHNNGFLDCPETDGNEPSSCGTIYRIWTAQDACGNTIACTQVITLESSNLLEAESSIDMLSTFPSPTPGAISIALETEQTTEVLIQVLDISGTVRMEDSFEYGGHEIKMDLSGLEPGTYILRTTQGDEINTERIVKI